MNEKNLLTRMSNFIFDLDGTLINTGNFILKSLQMSLDEVGVKVEPSKIHKRIIGPPLDVLLKRLDETISDEAVAEVIVAMRRIQSELPSSEYPAFDGVMLLLNTLKSNGKKLFVATNRGKMTAVSILKANAIHHLFDDVYTIDKYDGKSLTKAQMIEEIIEKHGLEKTDTVMIGDTDDDLKGAQTANCEFVGVGWGYAKDQTQFEINSKYYVKSAEEIISL